MLSKIKGQLPINFLIVLNTHQFSVIAIKHDAKHSERNIDKKRHRRKVLQNINFEKKITHAKIYNDK